MTRLVLVLGCHRSGTSLAAKSLECLGVSLGDNANWSAPDNPSGFHEDRDILSLDERLLYYVKSGWDDPTPIRDFSPLDRYIAPAAQLLAHKLERFPLLGIKEPRMCRLLPFWRRVFAEIGCDVACVHVVRHPTAVATSLQRRNRLYRRVCLDLWSEYVTRQYADADPAWPAWTVQHDAAVSEPAHTVRKIGAALGLVVDEDRLQQFCANFIRKPEPAALRFFQYLPPDIAEQWDTVREMAA